MAVDYICDACGGNTVTRDAWGEWDATEQDWVLGAVYDYAFCHDCQQETHLEEIELEEPASPDADRELMPRARLFRSGKRGRIARPPDGEPALGDEDEAVANRSEIVIEALPASPPRRLAKRGARQEEFRRLQVRR
jgi:hypothetical protein